MTLRPENFTEQAREALAASQQLAQEYRHAQWDLEHLLLAMLQQKDSVPLQVLKEMNVDATGLERRIESSLARTPKLQSEATQMYQTPRIVRALQSAKNEADRFKDEYVGT